MIQNLHQLFQTIMKNLFANFDRRHTDNIVCGSNEK